MKRWSSLVSVETSIVNTVEVGGLKLCPFLPMPTFLSSAETFIADGTSNRRKSHLLSTMCYGVDIFFISIDELFNSIFNIDL